MMEKLIDRRIKKGYSVLDMAKRLDIDRTTYYRYEQGQRKMSIERAQEVAKILDVNLEDII